MLLMKELEFILNTSIKHILLVRYLLPHSIIKYISPVPLYN